MQKVDISKTFSKAITASKQEQKITDLQTEIEELRAKQSPNLEKQLEKLRQELREKSGEQFIELSKIRTNDNQPRQTFTEESVESLASSLDKDGQITPIILIPQDNDYLIWDGERRYRSAQLLKWEKIKAVTAPMPLNLHRKSLLTFIHHEDLNALDKAEAIVQEINSVTDLSLESIPSGVRALVRRLERNGEILKVKEVIYQSHEIQQSELVELDLSEEQRAILGVLLDLQLNPASIAANDLQMLSLFEDIKLRIRQDGLKGAHALILQKLNAESLNVTERKAKNIREKAVEQVLNENLNVSRTRLLVQSLIDENTGEANSNNNARKLKRLLLGLERIDFTDLDQEHLEEVRNLLQIKLNELRSMSN